MEVEPVNRSPKPPLEKVLRIWTREWFREGREMDLSNLPTRPGFETYRGGGSPSVPSRGSPTIGA